MTQLQRIRRSSTSPLRGKVHKLPLKPLPSSDQGRLFVRLNHKYRGDVDRYGITRLVNVGNEHAILVLMLGHDCDEAIFMPYDIRTKLEARNGGELEFRIEKAGLSGRLIPKALISDSPGIPMQGIF